MLVLTQTPGDTIRVGDVTFKIVAVRGRGVRVGIEAPADIAIERHNMKHRRSATHSATTERAAQPQPTGEPTR